MNTQTTIGNDEILRGYTSLQTAYKVDDYPYGFRLRTSIFYWIETKENLGDRFCSCTINPKTGKLNKPKCGTYSPFQYMYLDEKNYVQVGGIDSYDKEIFSARFYFITERIGEIFINDIQKQNLRVNHYRHVYASAPYEIARYSEAMKPVFKQWLTDTLTHIKKCEFANLVNYPDRPTEDNPEGEIKMTVTTYSPAN